MLKLIQNVKNGHKDGSVLSNAVVVDSIQKFNSSYCKKIAPTDTFIASTQYIQGDNCGGRFLLSGRSDGSLFLYKVKDDISDMKYECECIWSCKRDDRRGHRFSVECVGWFPTDNGIFVTGGFDCKLKTWDTSVLKCVDTISFPGRIFNFDLSPGTCYDSIIAVCCSKGAVSIIDLANGTNIHTFESHEGDVLTCQWSPNDQHILATGGVDNKVFLWDIRSSKRYLKCLNRCYSINTIDEPNTFNSRSHFTAHTGAVNSLKFVKNGHKLITCGTDNVIRLWDVMTGKNELVEYDSFINNVNKRHLQIDTSRGTKPEFMFIPSKELILMYEVETGRLVKSLEGHFSNVNCCYYNKFSNELYTGDTDAIVVIWCDETFKKVAYEESVSK